jgi:2-polyprenyl-6-methoxyphenol hydroxylase-like FAD-dependent oxidoreductase
MRIAVLGGGPAGLYFSTLWKIRHPQDQVTVYEQNPNGATFGFGVVLSERALDFLREDDPDTYDLITPRLETWREITLYHRGEQVRIDGMGFSAIGRLELIQLLQKRASSVGATLEFSHIVHSLEELAGVDLIVAADGLNSLVRRTFEGDFSPTLSYLDNKFAWYGTTKTFDTLSHTFVETKQGTFNAHHYRYAPDASTFIVECDRATWERAGFAEMAPDDAKLVCEGVFAEALDGHKLISNRSAWRNFPRLWCNRWSFRNMVLVGDALHTAHFSIGSGTRLALEDVIALVKALESGADLPAAFQKYEAARRPILEKLVRAANTSAEWYEHFDENMRLPPLEFAHSYITRSGRIDDERLRKASPLFMAKYDKYRAGRNAAAARS